MSKKKQDQHKDEMNTPEISENQAADAGKPDAGTANEKDELTQLRENVAELNDKYLRLYSEFDNYKRRTARERIELLQSASRDLMLALLPVMDDFERAERSFEKVSDLEALKEGVQLIHAKLRNVLTQNGLQALESIGKDFDVDFHEAVTKIPAPGEDMKGKVVDEVERGYLLRDKVIRFAKVVVGE